MNNSQASLRATYGIHGVAAVTTITARVTDETDEARADRQRGRRVGDTRGARNDVTRAQINPSREKGESIARNRRC